MPIDEIIPGFYGKLPFAGDFVTRRLPSDFINSWDAWLQESLHLGKQKLGSQFQVRYQTGPIWRFVLGPGVCGKNAAAGILIPSVDRVGRAFPLTLAIVTKDPLSHWIYSGAQWFLELEAVAGLITQQEVDLNQFDQRLQALTLTQTKLNNTATFSEKVLPIVNPPEQLHLKSNRLNKPEDTLIYLSPHLLERYLPIYTMWSSAAEKPDQASLSVFNGMPPTTDFEQFIAKPPKTSP